MRLILIFLCITFMFGANELDKLPYHREFDGVEIELLISYKIISEDNRITKEAYRVSQVMNPKGEILQTIGMCEVDASAYAIMDDMPYFISTILKREKEQVLDCLYNHEVHIRETTSGRSNALRSRATLSIAPTRVSAKLENKSIVLKILSKEGT